MKEIPVASLVVSIYNKIDNLKMILAALERQSFKGFEVIIADDGSKQEVVDEIRLLQTTLPFQVQHLWQEDDGFRKTTILNEAIRRAKTGYLIFIDGDCVPHQKFIEEHYNNRKTKLVLAGRRVNLSPRLTAKLNADKIRKGALDAPFFTFRIFIDSMLGKSNHVIKGFYVKNSWLRRFLNRKVTGILGCNFSIHKKDLLDINGFDERYKAPALGEDTDVELRLRWNGVTVKMIKNIAIQYHLYHKLLERSSINEALYEQVSRSNQYFTPDGITKTNAVI